MLKDIYCYGKRLSLASLLFAPLIGVGQAAPELKLEEAVALALKNSYELQIAKNEVEANKLLNHYGVAGGLPTVNGALSNVEQINNIRQNLSNGTSIERNGATGNNLAANVNASIVLYNGKRIVSTKRRLELLEKQSEDQLFSNIQNTIADVETSYYDIVRQQSYIKTLRQSILASEKRLEVLEARKAAGMANNADIFQAQLDINASTQALTNQELVVEIAKSELLRLLSLNPMESVAINDTIVVEDQLRLDEVMASVMKNAEVKAAETQIRISEFIQKEVGAQRYPTLRLNSALNYTRNQSTAGFNLLNQSMGPNIGLSVAVPIYNGGAFKRQQQVANVNIKSAENRKQIVERDLQANAYKTFQSYKTTLKQLEIEAKNYKLAQDLLQLTMQRFELIQATIIEVREAQKSFEEAGYRLVNLNYAAKAAEIELKRLSNQLE